jgi:hypothetical protein
MAVYKRGENWYIDLSLRVRESGSPRGVILKRVQDDRFKNLGTIAYNLKANRTTLNPSGRGWGNPL